MSLEDELLRDLDTDSESDGESEKADFLVADVVVDGDNDVEMTTVTDELSQLAENGNEVSTSDLLNRIDIESIQDITKLTKLRTKLSPIIHKIDSYLTSLISKKEEYEFLMSVNSLSLEITNEISLIYTFIKSHYSKRFPELSSLISNPIEYAKLIKRLGNDLEMKENEVDFLTKEKILVLTMSLIQAKQIKPLEESELRKVFAACDLLFEFDRSKSKITEYVSSRLAVFAPNLSAVVGPTTSSQFLSILGGLNTLAKTPSCNVASLGSKRSVGIGFGQSGIQQQGFLYYSDLIQGVSPDLRKQAMRIAAGKIVLAARVDLTNGSPNGELGKKWFKEIQEKIEKLEEPPDVQKQKALPIPIDKPAKKRAGRRYRKLKQRFEASELRKAQNRVEFGKKESTITDSYGEEIGLGMSGSLSRMPLNTNTQAKVTKKMKIRLKATAASEGFFNHDFINIPKSNKE